jgi:hypothetical protein
MAEKARETRSSEFEEEEEALFDLISDRRVCPRIEGIVVGSLVGFDDGVPLVDFRGNPNGAARARIAGAISEDDVGMDVALAFEDGEASRPLVLGRVLSGLPRGRAAPSLKRPEIEIDGERIVLTAERELVLRCGATSITLRRDGRVSIRGARLLSRSSGPNRIKGGSVQIN